MSDSPADSGGGASPAHVPVLLREVLRFLQPEAGLTVVDGTVGAAGHSREILKRVGPSGKLIGLDRDPHMLTLAANNLSEFSPNNFQLIHASYAQLESVLAGLHIAAVDRILLDVGLSSVQLADDERGFGFQSTGPLDLRFDTSQGEPAWQLLAHIEEDELADLIHEYGEEPQSRRLARHLVTWRTKQPIHTGRDLATAVAAAGASRSSGSGSRHPATRVFQALRIAVNDELRQLEVAMQDVLHRALVPGGIAVVISFHSLEDRLVKQAFRESNLWHNLTPKPVTASTAEQRLNPRSRTAKLRAATKK